MTFQWDLLITSYVSTCPEMSDAIIMEDNPKNSTQEHTGGGYIASADVVDMYGDWVQPSEQVALEKFYKVRHDPVCQGTYRLLLRMP